MLKMKNLFKKTPEKKKVKKVTFIEREAVIERSVTVIQVDPPHVSMNGRGSLDDEEVEQKSKSDTSHRPSISSRQPSLSDLDSSVKHQPIKRAQSFPSLLSPSASSRTHSRQSSPQELPEDIGHSRQPSPQELPEDILSRGHSHQSSPTQSFRRVGSSSSLCGSISEEDDADLLPTPLNRVQSSSVIMEVEAEIKNAADAGTDPQPVVNKHRMSFSFSSPRDSIIKISGIEQAPKNLAEVAEEENAVGPDDSFSPKFTLRNSVGRRPIIVTTRGLPPDAEEENKSSQGQAKKM